jgi:MSHA biogenesis protein MshG
VATLILLIFVIPVFSNVYQSMRVDLPLITQSLITASDFVIRYWWGILGALALGGLGASQWVRTREGRYAWDKIQLRLPIFGPMLRKVAIGRFCESFATAHRSGVSLVDAFDLVSRIVDNAFLEERILQMRQGLERGESFSRVARGASIFNQTELQMIIVGEESGDIEKMVSQIAGMHQEEVAYDVTRLSKSMEPVLLGFMGVLVGLLLLGIFTPLWDLGQLNLRPA